MKCPPDQIYITNTGYNLLSLNINLIFRKIILVILREAEGEVAESKNKEHKLL